MSKRRLGRQRGVSLLILLSALLAACGTSQLQSPLATPPLTESGAAPSAELLTQVRRDLAERLGVEEASIETLRVGQVEWSDGSLGCPEPGKAYTEAVEPGYRVVLRAGEQTYEYHTAQDRFVLCEAPSQAGQPDYAPELQALLDKAKADLTGAVGVNASAIHVQSIEEKTWNDSALGCPQPGVAYLTVITPGYRIVLEANGKDYAYHTSHDEVVLCQRELGKVRPPPEAAELVEGARQDLAAELDLAPDQILLVRLEAVDWRDGSLGCPEPGKGYITMIIPGYLFVLEANGQSYEYHASDTSYIRCDSPPNNQ
jgi:hypothetical protein